MRQHRAGIESIQKEQASREHDKATHDETKYNDGNNRRRYEPMDEYEA